MHERVAAAGTSWARCSAAVAWPRSTLAHDTRLGRTVAVKTLRADLARDPSFQARFRREAQSAASLNHPAIVAVYDTGEDYIDGASDPVHRHGVRRGLARCASSCTRAASCCPSAPWR